VIFISILAVLAPIVAPYPYYTQDLSQIRQAPSAQLLLGTDSVGRDVLSRILYGAGISLLVALVVELIELLIGVTLGTLAGYLGGKVDAVIMRITDIFFAFPDILMAILIMAAVTIRSMGEASSQQSAIKSLVYVFMALGIVGWPGMARLVRGQVLSLKERDFVQAARAIGASDFHIVIRHILPNTLSPIIVSLTVGVAGIIMAEATLSFLGIGIQPPYPSWGSMISDAKSYLRQQPWLVFAPAGALSLTVLAFNFLGDGLRDALDPKMKGS
jgi:ABC-type dipeptide/oligopeptide/nickel transport system permease subunit